MALTMTIFPTRTRNYFTIHCGRCSTFIGEADVFRWNGSEEIAVRFFIDIAYVHKRDDEGEFWEIPKTSQRDRERLKSPVARHRNGSGQVHLPPNDRDSAPVRYRQFDTQYADQRNVRVRCTNCQRFTVVALLDTTLTSRYSEV